MKRIKALIIKQCFTIYVLLTWLKQKNYGFKPYLVIYFLYSCFFTLSRLIFLPLIKAISILLLFISSTSPEETITVASFPSSMVPTVLSIPRIFAGDEVMAVSASSLVNP